MVAQVTARKLFTLLLLAAALSAPALAQQSSATQPKPATEATKAANRASRTSLNFNDRQDFEDATRGLIAKPDTLTIKDAKGNVVWDLEQYKNYIGADKPAPDTVNPSLWRNAQLNMQHGLFQVHDRIFQVRGYDLSNITFIQGDTGWIVFDPLISAETAKAALDLVTQHLGRRPVVAVVYSHSHVDHYGGVRGIVDEADVKAGKVQILAPEHFAEHAISENVIAGNAMGRRAIYMYGALLPRNAQGGVNGGLGQTTSTGTAGLILPTREIKTTGEEVTIDGVRMVFQMTPGTEAPAEMNTYFPQFRAMWMAENTTNTLHNVLTLRGAQVRDPLKWASFLNETIDLYGPDVDVKFQAHHWPLWGNAKIIDYWKKQRDLYKYHARPVGEPDEQGLHRHRDLQHGQAAAGARQAMVQPRLLRHGASTTRAPSISATWASTTAIRRRSTSCRPTMPPRSTSSTWAARRRSCRRRRPTSTRASIAGSPKSSSSVVFADPNNKDAQGAARRRLRADGLSGRIRSVALDLSAGRLRAAQRRAVGWRHQHREPRHHQGDAAGDDVRLFRRAAERREGGRQEARAEHRLHRSQQVLRAGGRERRAQLLQEGGRRTPTPSSR